MTAGRNKTPNAERRPIYAARANTTQQLRNFLQAAPGRAKETAKASLPHPLDIPTLCVGARKEHGRATVNSSTTPRNVHRFLSSRALTRETPSVCLLDRTGSCRCAPPAENTTRGPDHPRQGKHSCRITPQSEHGQGKDKAGGRAGGMAERWVR